MFGKTKADDIPPIVQEVTHHGEVLDNHEDRLSNNEKDIAKLQAKTQVAPSQNKTTVREVVTPKADKPITLPTPAQPESAPKPEPVVVTSYKKIPTGEGYNGENIDCELTYSDGTTYRWPWQTVRYNQVKITSYSDTCDSSVIGQPKN